MRLLLKTIPLFLAFGILVSCGPTDATASASKAKGGPSPSGNRRSNAISVLTVQGEMGTLTGDNETSGSVIPVTQSSVAAQISGIVKKVYKRVGERVDEGEVVVQLDDSQLRLSLRTAQSNFENAKINLEIGQDNTSSNSPKLALQLQSAQTTLSSAQKSSASAEALFKLGGIAESDLDNAKAQLQQAQANLEAAKIAVDQNKKSDVQNIAQLKLAVDSANLQVQQAQLNLQFAAIKAPFAGQLSVVNVTPGSSVGTNTVAFVLVSPDKEVSFSVPPSDAPSLTRGTKITFTVNGQSMPITIDQLPSAPVNGTVPLTAALPASYAIPFGTVGSVRYSLQIAKAILLPITTLQSNEDKTFVYIIQNGKAVAQNVTILAESRSIAAVTGIQPGSTVIVSPPPGLLTGAAVQAVQNSGNTEPPSPSPDKTKWNGNRNGQQKPGAVQ